MRGASLRGTGIVLIAIQNRYRDLNIVIYGDDTCAVAHRRLNTLFLTYTYVRPVPIIELLYRSRELLI